MRKLYFSNGSPFARKVRIVLFEKGLEFEADVNNLVRPVEEIEPLNPALQVPVLIDGGRPLFDSDLIISYLFDAYPDSNSTVTPPLSATVTRTERHWDDLLILTTIEALADAIVNLRLMAGVDEDQSWFLARQRHRIGACLNWLGDQITPEGFWPETFSVMDINLLCPLLFGEKRKIFDFRTGQWPNIAQSIDSWRDRPSITATPVAELSPDV